MSDRGSIYGPYHKAYKSAWEAAAAAREAEDRRFVREFREQADKKPRKTPGRPPRTKDPKIQARMKRILELQAEHPKWKDLQFAEALKCDARTIERTRRAFE
jgi:hypothetical protein